MKNVDSLPDFLTVTRNSRKYLLDLLKSSADMTLKTLASKDYVNQSPAVFNIGAANSLPAYSMEIGVPVDGRNLHLKAVEKIIEVAAKHRKLGNVYQTGPISLRFVKATDSYLSMCHAVHMCGLARTLG